MLPRDFVGTSHFSLRGPDVLAVRKYHAKHLHMKWVSNMEMSKRDPERIRAMAESEGCEFVIHVCSRAQVSELEGLGYAPVDVMTQFAMDPGQQSKGVTCPVHAEQFATTS